MGYYCDSNKMTASKVRCSTAGVGREPLEERRGALDIVDSEELQARTQLHPLDFVIHRVFFGGAWLSRSACLEGGIGSIWYSFNSACVEQSSLEANKSNYLASANTEKPHPTVLVSVP